MNCPACDCLVLYRIIENSIDGIPCEISYHCRGCKSYVDYWAYGIYASGRKDESIDCEDCKKINECVALMASQNVRHPDCDKTTL